MFGFQEVRLEVGNPGSAKSHKKRQRKTSASTRTLSQVSDLARGLPGYHFVYQPAMLYMEKFQERKEEGLAVFSRYPIVTSHYKLLFKLVTFWVAMVQGFSSWLSKGRKFQFKIPTKSVNSRCFFGQPTGKSL